MKKSLQKIVSGYVKFRQQLQIHHWFFDIQQGEIFVFDAAEKNID